MDEACIITEGNQVLLQRGDSSRMFVVRCKRQVTFEKAKFNLDGLVGLPFGTTFELKNGELVKVSPLRDTQQDADEQEAGQDNRNLVGSGENQKLGPEEIKEMKDKGMAGDAIIEQLVENSETFKTKTKFSQEKYIKKKKKKYLMVFTALRPSPRLLMDMYHAKNPNKVGNLRLDSLAQILSYSNAMAGTTVAVVDTCQGLVLAGVMERLGGHGNVINFHAGDSPSRQAVEYMDFPKAIQDTLMEVPLSKVSSLGETDSEHKLRSEETTTTDTHAKAEATEPLAQADLAAKETEAASMETDREEREGTAATDSTASTGAANFPSDAEMSSEAGNSGQQQKRKHSAEARESREANRERRARQLEEVKQLYQSHRFDSLIVAGKFHPTPIVLELIKGVAPSRPVVVFSQHKEPLMDCWQAVRERGLAIKFKLTETWFRSYQVLPDRTHPINSMSGTGGYLLTFTTVVSSIAQ